MFKGCIKLQLAIMLLFGASSAQATSVFLSCGFNNYQGNPYADVDLAFETTSDTGEITFSYVSQPGSSLGGTYVVPVTLTPSTVSFREVRRSSLGVEVRTVQVNRATLEATFAWSISSVVVVGQCEIADRPQQRNQF